MRKFLKDIKICGGVGVWSEGEIIRYPIESLLRICDTVFITCDYSNEKTQKIVDGYKRKYPDRIIVGDTSARVPSPVGMTLPQIMGRQKTYCGQLIECNFDMMKEYHKTNPIDILIFLDSDECLTTNIPKVLERFWNTTDIDTIFIKPIEVYGDLHIICSQGLVSHAKIYKFVPEITSIPYSQQNFYRPYRLTRRIWKESWNFVHLARLTETNRKLRSELRQGVSNPEMKLRRISKPAYELTPAEAQIVDTSEKFIRLKDFSGDINSVPLIL
jgi:hypothetical protein